MAIVGDLAIRPASLVMLGIFSPLRVSLVFAIRCAVYRFCNPDKRVGRAIASDFSYTAEDAEGRPKITIRNTDFGADELDEKLRALMDKRAAKRYRPSASRKAYIASSFAHPYNALGQSRLSYLIAVYRREDA
ncbi:MAG: hypothetical protein OXG60_14085 [Chloroflexi bacterium]|nr:hypothetical protein [Chloroflexota bacterium]